jgi:hypothetical protein
MQNGLLLLMLLLLLLLLRLLSPLIDPRLLPWYPKYKLFYFFSMMKTKRDLIYAPQDATRSSPFFWAFAKAFSDTADQIFSITDAIPAPIKVVGPATQKIDFSPESGKGRFVSQVKVATLGGMATSLMTTKAAITGIMGVDGIQLKIETTKPEESTVLTTLLGPLGPIVNENIPAFPSGEALEKVMPGSSEVIMRTTFCDEGIRISRNDDKPDEIFVWRRREFGSYDML